MLSSDEITVVLDHHTSVIELLTSGATLAEVHDSIVRALEGLMPGSRCSILLLDEAGRLRHGSAPSLPRSYSEAIDGLVPGPEAGSCGTAVHLGSQVVAVDVTTDPRWGPFRDLAAQHGLRACWSSPIHRGAEIAGTFAVYHGEPYGPGARDTELVRRFTHLASLAIDFDAAAAATEARHESELARQGAERANLAKSQFVTALSHELRAPLQAITGFTENLFSLDLSPQRRRDALERIGRGAGHILSIVDDVLDLARVEAGAMPIDFGAVDVASEVIAGVEIIQPLAQRRQVSVDVTVDVNVDGDAAMGPIDVQDNRDQDSRDRHNRDRHSRDQTVTVWADRRRLRQVVINLVSNAVRFSPPDGTVSVTIDRLPGSTESYASGSSPSGPAASEPGARESHPHGAVRIHVVDRGPGIPRDLLARLFVPFDQLGADSGREGGAGLGLVLARRLAEAMHGTLDIDSEVGVGTHATVCLPVRPAPHGPDDHRGRLVSDSEAS